MGFARLGAMGRGLGTLGSLGSAGGSLPNLSLSAPVMFSGDSITSPNTPMGVYAYPAWFQVLTDGNYYCGPSGNRGVAGERIDQILAHTDADLALNPGVKLVNIMAGTNDVTQRVSGSRTAALVIADLTSFYAKCRAAGARIIAYTVPRASTYDANQETMRGDINTWIKAQAASDLKVVDVESLFDPATQSQDGVHPDPGAAYQIAKAGAVYANAWMDPAATLLTASSPSGNLFSNWGLTGTNGGKFGGVTGSVASSMDVSGYTNGPSVVCSKTTLRGYTAQRIVLSGTPTASGIVSVFLWGTSFSAVDGSNYEAFADYEVAASPTGINGFRTEMLGYLLSSAVAVPDTDPLWSTDTISGCIRTMPITKVGSGAVLPHFFYIGCDANVPVSLDITFARPVARLVP